MQFLKQIITKCLAIEFYKRILKLLKNNFFIHLNYLLTMFLLIRYIFWLIRVLNKALFFYSTLLDFRSRRILDGFIYALNCSPCFLAEKRCLLQYFYAARKMLSTLTFWRGMCSLPFPIFNFGVHFINTKYFWYFMYVYTKQIWIVLFLQ